MLYDSVEKSDELENYLRTDIFKVNDPREFNPIEWWVANMSAYSTLAKMTFDYLLISAMSVEPERVFSGYFWFSLAIDDLVQSWWLRIEETGWASKQWKSRNV